MEPSSPRTRPAAEVRIDVALVHRLLESQFPHWSGLSLTEVESPGWDNAIYRLGADLAVRLPRRAIGAGQVSKEHEWLPVLGPRLPLAIPVPVGKGMPGEGYPWRWTVCPWLPGEMMATSPAAKPRQAALRLARFLTVLQSIDCTGGPVREFRDGPLANRDPMIRAAAALGEEPEVRRALAAWDAALAAPPWTGPPVWMHGDLHPANLLVRRGELIAVIDFGLLGVGDPACDLMVAWTVLSAEVREMFRSAVPANDATWARARGWALDLGIRAAAYSADNPVVREIGLHTIAEVLADFAGEQT